MYFKYFIITGNSGDGVNEPKKTGDILKLGRISKKTYFNTFDKRIMI